MYQINKIPIEVKHHSRIVRGCFLEPADKDSYPVIIFSHGYNGNGEGAHRIAEFMAQHGIGAVYYDFCGGSVKSKSDMDTTKMTLMTEKEDLTAVFNEVSGWKKTEKDRIFLFGESQGGMVTTLAASELSKDIAAVVLLYPAFCIPDDWNKKFPNDEDIPDRHEFWGMELGKEFFLNLREIDAYKVMDKLPHKVLIMHGDKDEAVPIRYSERAKEVMPDAVFEIFPDEGHGFSEEGYNRMIQMTYNFITTKVI